jgi:hypothetical protein
MRAVPISALGDHIRKKRTGEHLTRFSPSES